jgi:hypothetical protein
MVTNVEPFNEIYFKVPNFEKFSVSENGSVIDTVSGDLLEQRLSANYLCINADGVSYHVHRLMAIALLPSPNYPISELDVNHKDGNKLNNIVSNLEWATRSENCIHAYKTGLRPDNTPILVKDLRTDNIVEHYSLQECARAFGVNGALIHYYLRNTNKVRKQFFVFIRKGQEWPNLTKDDIVTRHHGVPSILIGKHLDTGKTVIFGSIGEAADILNIKTGTLYVHIKRYGDKPYHGYAFRFSDDPELNSKIAMDRDSNIPKPISQRKPVPISVIDLETQEASYWNSTEEFAKSVGVKKNTVQARVYRTGGFWDKYKISYMDS